MLAVLERQDEVDSLTAEDARLCMKLLICCCDQRHLQGDKVPAGDTGRHGAGQPYGDADGVGRGGVEE